MSELNMTNFLHVSASGEILGVHFSSLKHAGMRIVDSATELCIVIEQMDNALLKDGAILAKHKWSFENKKIILKS